ncbi:MAG: hypothetical protein LC722_02665 [Actinobacteria bacterium]|nr:hypothetical protein [Actinomycetota bacterium]
MPRRRGVVPAEILWTIVLIAIGVGAFTLGSVGWELILFGVLLGLLVPLRRDPGVFWPLAIGLVVFLGGYVAIAPSGCTTGARVEVGREQVPVRFCDSLVGFEYEREGTEDPNPFPAFAAAIGAGLVAAAVVRLPMRPRYEKRAKDAPEGDGR